MWSNLRFLGLVIGIIGLVSIFFYFRGPRWRKSNFIIFSLFNIFLIAISIHPGILNILGSILALEQHERGRIIALLIMSNLFLWFFILYLKDKQEKSKDQYDLLIRALCLKQSEDMVAFAEKIKPIMIVIPAFNEADNLRELLERIPSKIKGMEVGVIVVDDGSSDDTSGVVEKMGHLCIRNIISRGQGAASRLGYDVLIANDVQIGVTMDADNQHRPEDIETLILPILEDRSDLVIGSRIIGKRNRVRNRKRKIRDEGIVLFSWIISSLLGVRLTDCSSGFKAFNEKWMHSIRLNEDQFQSTEVIIDTVKKGLRIKEVPITVVNRKYGKSKKGTDWSYGFKFSKVIMKTWFRR